MNPCACSEQHQRGRIVLTGGPGANGEDSPAVVLCDRGTVDGAAYWPGPDELWQSVETTREAQLARYDAVIHLHTPAAAGYNHRNPVRIESAAEALAIDARIAQARDGGHPRRHFVESTQDFLARRARPIQIPRNELPECCRRHLIPNVDRP